MLKHTDITHGLYYHISINGDPVDWTIMKTDSQDDPYRWTGPAIQSDTDGDLEFQNGSESEHGAYFGGEEDNRDTIIVRYATTDEIVWLNDCIKANKLVGKPNQKLNNMKVKALTSDMVGKKFTCSIEGHKVEDGRIQYEGNSYFLCQNEISGSSCIDKLGYGKSWSILDGTKYDLEKTHITNLVILDEFSLEASNPIVPQKIDEKKLVDGEIYKYIENYIFMQKAKSGRAERAYALTWIKPTTRGYGTTSDISGGRYMTTTLEEKAHIRACIDAGKYVDPPKIELNQEQMDFIIQAMLVKSEE